MKNYLILVWMTGVLLGCREKEAAEPSNYISVLSLIKGQVAHIDTSLGSIRKVVVHDSLHSDTSYIPREKFSESAQDFLSIPDLGSKKVAKRYREEKARYDDVLNRVVITYSPIDPTKEEIKKQELLVTPNIATGDKVNNIIINRTISNKDSFMEKKMLWQMDKSFQIVTITQKPGQSPKTVVTTVTWNEDGNQ